MIDWIPVSDLPKDHPQYKLFLLWNNGWRIGYLDSSRRWLEQGGHVPLGQVTHFAELPPGPNGEQ